MSARARASVVASCLLLGTIAAAEEEPEAPAAGVFLVADESLVDPNFQHTVVLLLAYGADGAIGVIINRPTGHDLSELAPDKDVPDPCPLHFGGPVNPAGVITLVRTTDPPDGSVPIFGDVAMIELSESDGLDARYFVGHAGWGPGQLQGEIAAGAWGVRPANARYVFDVDAEHVWPALAKRDLAGLSWGPLPTGADGPPRQALR